LCQGRGSAANSAVCFALGITEIDPARSNLLFERFLSRERNEPPDIDVDFEHERREEVIQYIFNRYGRRRAALAAVVSSYHAAGAIRDVGKALGLPPDQVDALARCCNRWSDRIPDAQRLRDAGLDPDSPLVPVENAAMEDRTVIQWDKDDLDAVGLLKVDVLALGMLTALRRCFDLVRHYRGRELTLATIPAGDEPTYSMISQADTIGVFQI